MAKKKKGGKTPESYKIDFTGVESGGRARYPEGDYIAKITKIEPGQNDDGDKKYLAVTFEFTEGKFAGKTVKEFYHITPKALFRLKNLLEVLGLTVPSRVVNLPLKKMIGKEIGITVADDEYDNKIKSVVSDTIDPEVVRSGGVDDDEDVLEDDDEEEDDEDDEDEEDLDDLDRAGLKAYIKENELDVKVTKKMKDPAIRKAILAAQEEEGDDEEEDDDEMEEVDLEGL